MIEIIEGLIQRFKRNEITIYEDNLPFDFDMKNVGIFYNIDNLQDEQYKEDISFTINIVASKNNRYKQLALLTKIETMLNKFELSENTQIIKKNAYLNILDEKDTKTLILEFWVKKYK